MHWKNLRKIRGYSWLVEFFIAKLLPINKQIKIYTKETTVSLMKIYNDKGRKLSLKLLLPQNKVSVELRCIVIVRVVVQEPRVVNLAGKCTNFHTYHGVGHGSKCKEPNVCRSSSGGCGHRRSFSNNPHRKFFKIGIER